MTQFLKPFEPIQSDTRYVANSGTASALADLPESCDVVALYNTSTTAIAFFHCHPYDSSNAAVAVLPTTSPVGDIPIPPSQQIRISVPKGKKQFSVIATAADGNLYITPGIGN